MRSMVEIGWTAGFLEGEGSFLHTTPAKTSPYGTVIVTAAQVQREPLERLRRLYGGALFTYRQARHPRWQPQSTWRVSGARAAALMMTLYPFMSPRRKEQIEKVLAVWKSRDFRGSSKDELYRPIRAIDLAIWKSRDAYPSLSQTKLAALHSVSRTLVKRVLLHRKKAGGRL